MTTFLSRATARKLQQAPGESSEAHKARVNKFYRERNKRHEKETAQFYAERARKIQEKQIICNREALRQALWKTQRENKSLMALVCDATLMEHRVTEIWKEGGEKDEKAEMVNRGVKRHRYESVDEDEPFFGTKLPVADTAMIDLVGASEIAASIMQAQAALDAKQKLMTANARMAEEERILKMAQNEVEKTKREEQERSEVLKEAAERHEQTRKDVATKAAATAEVLTGGGDEDEDGVGGGWF